MYKKFLVTVVLFLFIGICIDSSDILASSKIKNNGNNYVQYKGRVYFIKEEAGKDSNYSYTLYRMKLNSKEKKKLDSWNGYFCNRKLYIHNGKIYYQRNEIIASSKLNRKSHKSLIEGELYGMFQNSCYYVKGDKLYTLNIKKKISKKIIHGNILSRVGCEDKVLLVNNYISEDYNQLYYINMKSGKSKLLINEVKRVTDAKIYKKTIYYICGNYQGSAAEFYNGELKSILDNGKKSKSIESVSLDMLYRNSNYIYYYKAGEKWNLNYCRFKLNNGSKKVIDTIEYRGETTGKYIYSSEEINKHIVIYRHSINKKAITKRKIATIKKQASYTYTVDNIVQVGDYIYLELKKTDYNDPNAGWRGTYKGTEYFKFKKLGKKLMRL